MENSNVRVYYPNESYDQSSWVIEKTDNTLKELCRLVSMLKGKKELMDLDDSLKSYSEDIYYSLQSALIDAFKLYCFLSGKKEVYNSENVNLLFQEGIEGYEKINHYNGIQKSDYITKETEDEINIEEIKSLINYDSNNRTLIYYHLSKIHKENEFTEKLKDYLEEVTMGEISWNEFVEKYK